MLTSIRLSSEGLVAFDSEGFNEKADEYNWGDSIAAQSRDAKAKERGEAIQLGYTVEKVFDIIETNYNGEAFLLDEGTGQTYIIRHASRKGARKVVLECEVNDASKAGWWL